MSGECRLPRSRPGLPGKQAALADAVLDTGKPRGGAAELRPAAGGVLAVRARAAPCSPPGILGSEAGNAVGDVLSGRCNPRPACRSPGRSMSGRSPSSTLAPPHRPALRRQHPLHQQVPRTSRTSRCSRSATACPTPASSCSNSARRSGASWRRGGSVTVDVDVANEGKVAGDETVLLFVRDPVATHLAAGARAEGHWRKSRCARRARGSVRLKLTTDDLTPSSAPISNRGSSPARSRSSSVPRHKKEDPAADDDPPARELSGCRRFAILALTFELSAPAKSAGSRQAVLGLGPGSSCRGSRRE